MRNLFVLAVTGAFLVFSNPASAQNLLSSGDFEPNLGADIGWELDEFVTGNSNEVNSAVIGTSTATQAGERHLWLRGFSGGEDPGPDNLTNALLTQTVDITGGMDYTFSGYSRFEANYSGGVDTLDSSAPLGAVSSPTETTMTLEFLDGTGSSIGDAVIFDVKQDRLNQVAFPILGANDNNWYQHIVNGSAPASATQARVTAGAQDMVWNVGPNQSAFYDTLSLTADLDPGTELLTNPGLDVAPPTGLEDWVIETNDPGNPANEEVIRAGAAFPFANNTPGGTSGVWMSSFFGEPETPVDGSVSQTQGALAGEEYNLTGWSSWETNFMADSVFIELAFLDSAEQVIGTPVSVDVGTERTGFSATSDPNDGEWYQHSLSGIAPAGTTSVRVSAGMIDGVNATVNPQSAFFDDFVLELVGGSTPGDFDGDGDVDGTDFVVWQRGGSPNPGSAGDLADWQGNYGAAAVGASFASVPEPTSLLLLLTFAGLACGHRKRS